MNSIQSSTSSRSEAVWKAVSLTAAFFVVGNVVADALASIVFTPISKDFGFDPVVVKPSIGYAFGSVSLIALSVLAYKHILGARLADDFRRPRAPALGALLLLYFAVFDYFLSGGYHRLTSAPVHSILRMDALAYISLIVVVVPVSEEIFFRGAIWAIAKPIGPVFQILLATCLFGAVHLGSTASVFAVSLLQGLVLSLVRYRCKSLIPSIAGHCFNNLLMMLITLKILV